MATVETSSLRRLPPGRLRGLAGVLATAFLVVTRPAVAFPEFPGIVLDTLSQPATPGGPVLTCPPPCMVCHDTPTGGLGTANQPFAVNLAKVPGVSFLTEANLPQALAGLETLPCQRVEDPGCSPDAMTMCTGQCDADGDGTPDVQALRTGKNPNGGGVLACPTYGCGARIAPIRPRRPIDGTAVLAALGALVVLASRWRRRS